MRGEFVGRRGELDVLVDCLEAAMAGQARVVLCRGEPGIGKTRLAEEFAATAGMRGCLIAWGQAAEAEVAAPYGPWRQVLRMVDDHVDVAAIAERCRLVGDLGRLAPDLFSAATGPPEGSSADEALVRSFDAVARLLGEVTRARPLLVVLDDAHGAGRSSLLLLHHLARSLATQRLLVLVNHRDTEPIPLLDELRRAPVTRQLELRGLSIPAVAAQLASLLGRSPTDGELSGVHGRTGGNPFYVGEIARVLGDPRARVDEAPVPDSVRAAIAARLDRLGPSAARVLQAASIVGRDFSVADVAPIVGRPVLGCLGWLDQATEAGFIQRASVSGEYRFVHDLVREAVEAGLSTPERVRLHRRAADAIERSFTGTPDGQLSDLARHWTVAAVAGERPRAAAWLQRAADEALNRLAFQEAAQLYRLAVAIGGQELEDDLVCRLLIAAGAALRHAGDLAERLVISRQAAALARRLGRPDLLAETALVLEGGETDLEAEVTLRRWCEEALATLDPRLVTLRAKVLATHSDVCMYLGDVDAARASSGHAITEAEQSGDLAAVAAALRARQLVATGPEGIGERSVLADRMAAIGRETRDPLTRMWAHLWRTDVAFQRGDLAAVRRELEPLAQCVAEGRSSVARWHLLQCSAVLAQAQARFADARRLADEALAGLPPTATGYNSAVINRTGVLGAIAMHTGDDVDLTALRAAGVGGNELDFPTEGVIFSIAAAFFFASTGRLAAAGTVYRRLGPPAHWRPIPHATTVCYAFGIRVAVALDARDDVAVLRRRLAPSRGQHLVSGAGAVAYDGPVELYLGVASGFLGHVDEAITELESAVRVCAANGASGFDVEARLELAAVLARRNRPGDVVRACDLARQVEERGAALGMRPWVDRARQLRARLDRRADPLTPREREVAALVAEGLTNRQIAARLTLSERTAQNHVQHILTKLNLTNRSQLAVRTVRETIRSRD